jgi:hypothetical protein
MQAGDRVTVPPADREVRTPRKIAAARNQCPHGLERRRERAGTYYSSVVKMAGDVDKPQASPTFRGELRLSPDAAPTVPEP